MTNMLKRDFPQLDAMRAIASIAVVATHTAFWSGIYVDGLFGAAAQRLEVGVAIFFVLSGFLLGRPWVAAALHGTPHDTAARYARKRALRIVPVYWVCVVAALALIGPNRELGVGRWVQNLLLVDLYRAQQLPQGLTQMWSLSVEVAFYLMLPIFGALIVRFCHLRPTRLLIALACVSLMSMAWVVVTHASSASWAPWAARWLPSYLTWFALGIAFAVISVESGRPGRFVAGVLAVARDRATCWIAAGAIFVLVSTPLGGSPLLIAPTTGEALARHIAYGVIAALVIAPSALGPDDTATARLLSHRFVRHVGHLSYSLFCCHMIVLYVLAPRMGLDLFNSSWPVLFAAILSISLVISEALYRFVELPFMRFKRGVSPKTTQSTAPSDTATHH